MEQQRKSQKMEKFYHQIKILLLLIILGGCSNKSKEELNKKEINDIIFSTEWSLSNSYSKYIDSINSIDFDKSSIQVPNFLIKYPNDLKKTEKLLSSHNNSDGRSLSYKLILDNSHFISVVKLKSFLESKEGLNDNEKIVLDIINYSFQ